LGKGYVKKEELIAVEQKFFIGISYDLQRIFDVIMLKSMLKVTN
jgi:hypothetical protein